MINVFYIFESGNLNEKTYNKFIDTGKISVKVLKKIAVKVTKNETLNEMELTVFYAKTADINEIILNLHK